MAEKRFPRKDTCLAIYSHRVNTQRPLADTLALMFPWCAEWEGGTDRAFPELCRDGNFRTKASTTTTCCSTGTR